MMDIEQSQQENFQYQIQVQHIDKRSDKKLVVSHQAEIMVSNFLNQRNRVVEHNKWLDQANTAKNMIGIIRTQQFGQFQYFMTKNRHRGQRGQIFNVMRQLAEQRKFQLIGRVKQKLQKSRMIVRVVSKQQNNHVFIQDQTGKQKMQMKNGTIWVGMFALMQVSWMDGVYKCDAVFDLSQKVSQQKPLIKDPCYSYKILFVKGSFMSNENKQNAGLLMLINELNMLISRQKTRIDTLVIMGPLLNNKNTIVKSGLSQFTYEEQVIEIIKLIKKQIHQKISQYINLVFMPSTDDITSMYPIPQPKYSFYNQVKQQRVFFTSNPGFLTLQSGRNMYKISLINHDILSYIDANRVGKPNIPIQQENIQSYFKQPFILSNTLQQPFDQTNLPALYNDGNFCDIVITSSRNSPPFARQAKGRLFINIGSLGLDQSHMTMKHYMTLLSIYDGEGPVSSRTKVQSLVM